MTTTVFRLSGLALLSTALLAGCASTAGMAQATPTFFSADIDDGRLTGQYNAAGFDTAEARTLLGSVCTGGGLASYGEQPGADGLVAFTATCAGGIGAVGGNVEFQRSGDAVVVEVTGYDALGTISTNQSSVTL
jgi:hypothetical protein